MQQCRFLPKIVNKHKFFSFMSERQQGYECDNERLFKMCVLNVGGTFIRWRRKLTHSYCSSQWFHIFCWLCQRSAQTKYSVYLCLAECLAGTFRSGDVCTDCSFDEYQEHIRQEACDPCGQSQITLQTGSILQAQCREFIERYFRQTLKCDFYERVHV